VAVSDALKAGLTDHKSAFLQCAAMGSSTLDSCAFVILNEVKDVACLQANHKLACVT